MYLPTIISLLMKLLSTCVGDLLVSRLGVKISGPPEIKGSEGCVSSYRYRVTRYFDFPTAMFSSKSATFNL